jgi:hypothetical protein
LDTSSALLPSPRAYVAKGHHPRIAAKFAIMANMLFINSVIPTKLQFRGAGRSPIPVIPADAGMTEGWGFPQLNG